MGQQIISISAVLLLTAGCATHSVDGTPVSELPSFHVGYGDGCTTSIEEDKSFSTDSARDEYAFNNDEAYRIGWRQGYLECNNRTPEAKDGGRILGERNEY